MASWCWTDPVSCSRVVCFCRPLCVGYPSIHKGAYILELRYSTAGELHAVTISNRELEGIKQHCVWPDKEVTWECGVGEQLPEFDTNLDSC